MKRFLMLLPLLLFWIATAEAQERKKFNFNSNWLLQLGDDQEAQKGDYDDHAWRQVTLPRAFNEDQAFAVDIRELTDTVMWYRKHFSVETLQNRKYFIEFEGVRQAGEFYINGHHLGRHENGVMAVGFDLTPYIQVGDNVVSVRVDNNWQYREKSSNAKFQWNDRNFNANYGGIPKNVYLHITDEVYQTLPLYSHLNTTGVYIYADNFDIPGRKATVHAESEVRNDSDEPRELQYAIEVYDIDGKLVRSFEGDKVTLAAGQTTTLKAQANMEEMHFWSWGYGYLYTVKTQLKGADGEVFDEVTTRTGFRKTQFSEGKIWLNDRVIMMHGYAQRTSNEWPAVGISVPAWLSDYSNGLQVESNGNLVRWMHVTPWKQDVESCDRVGLIQAMPAGDSERDRQGRQWTHRTDLMREAIIYNRNNPSILFYECGNESISREHMIEMKAIRDLYDPHGGRAIGSREMLDIREAEWGGEMLYINKSKHHPMWATEYCRDEGLRKYWDEHSYPFHIEGDGPLHDGKPATSYNHNQDKFALELIRRWYDYWLERPGQGVRVSAGGTKIVFSDTNTHHRGEENYRRSGVVDPMRIPKDAFYAHQVMWNGWVESDTPQTYIIGHWNYPAETVKWVYVVSNGERVELLLNGKSLGNGKREANFLFNFPNVKYEPGKLEAVSYDANGVEVSRYAVETAGEPAALRLTAMQNPEGFKADGADMALIQFEVVDKQGRRCPVDNRLVEFTLEGEAEWRGGIAQGENNYVLSTSLPVECGVNRALIRSTTKAGKITLTAKAEGLAKATLKLKTEAVEVVNGMSEYLPQYTTPCNLSKGETPLTPSYVDQKRTIQIARVQAGINQAQAEQSFDDNELSAWVNDGQLQTAWITYQFDEQVAVDDICMKLSGWRRRSYSLEIYAGDQLIWSGTTPKSLGYVHLLIENPVKSDRITISMKGASKDNDAFGEITEVAGNAANEMEATTGKGNRNLSIIEIDFLQNIQ